MPGKGEKKIINEMVRDNLTDFYLKMHESGVALPQAAKQKLIDAGLLAGPKDHKGSHGKMLRASERKFDNLNENELLADGMVDIVEGDTSGPETVVMTQQEYIESSMAATMLFSGQEKIEKKDWQIKNHRELSWPKEFVRWIDSINIDWRNRINYKKFNLYRQQAYQWLADKDGQTKLEDREGRQDQQWWLDEVERPRCGENSLYALNKYLVLFDGSLDGGGASYEAWECQEIICFLFDNEVSFAAGKGRQIGFTTTICGLFLLRILFRKNYFAKLIAQDDTKVQEIFEQKVKYPFSQLGLLKPGVIYDRDGMIHLGYKGNKGEKKGINSRMQVVPPKEDAINGGSPPLVGIDEAGYISILEQMIQEARPTQFIHNKETNRLELARQLVIWGTGGNMDKGGKAYEKVYNNLWKGWEDRNFALGIVPLFFDRYARRGVNEQHLKAEKTFYTSTEGREQGLSEVKFYQHYPRDKDDMFLTSSKTLMPLEVILSNQDRLKLIPHERRQEYGYFRPIFDENFPLPEDYNVPYRVIGAEWVKVEDESHPDAAAFIFPWAHPKPGAWKWRYYQGTDPIMSKSGYSNMASVMWDKLIQINNSLKHLCPVIAGVRFRPANHQDAYLQVMLMNLYFGNDIPNLVESNIGTGFIDYVTVHGHYNTIVPNAMLPDHLQGGGNDDGIDKRRGRSDLILDITKVIAYTYAKRIDVREYFQEHRHFVEKPITGGVKYEPLNLRYHRDDILDATTYSKTNADCHDRMPECMISEDGTQRRAVRHKYGYDKNGILILRKVLA